MLSVEGILALHNTRVNAGTFFPGCGNKRICHGKICNGRKFKRCVFLARSVHPNRRCGNDNISALYLRLNASAGSDSHKGVCPRLYQLFHCDGSRGPADSGRGHRHLLSEKSSGVGHIFPGICNQNRILQILRNLGAALRITGHNHIASDVFGSDLCMILFLRFRIVHFLLSSLP